MSAMQIRHTNPVHIENCIFCLNLKDQILVILIFQKNTFHKSGSNKYKMKVYCMAQIASSKINSLLILDVHILFSQLCLFYMNLVIIDVPEPEPEMIQSDTMTTAVTTDHTTLDESTTSPETTSKSMDSSTISGSSKAATIHDVTSIAPQTDLPSTTSSKTQTTMLDLKYTPDGTTIPTSKNTVMWLNTSKVFFSLLLELTLNDF